MLFVNRTDNHKIKKMIAKRSSQDGYTPKEDKRVMRRVMSTALIDCWMRAYILFG
jgi:hypothetical protein